MGDYIWLLNSGICRLVLWPTHCSIVLCAGFNIIIFLSCSLYLYIFHGQSQASDMFLFVKHI